MALTQRIKQELSKPFYNGWTLKDFIALGAILSVLVVDHAYVKGLREDVARANAGIEGIKQVIAVKSEEGARIHQEIRDGVARLDGEVNRLRDRDDRGR